jgi:hypothetical protein
VDDDRVLVTFLGNFQEESKHEFLLEKGFSNELAVCQALRIQGASEDRSEKSGFSQWLTPIILATQEAEIRRITV